MRYKISLGLVLLAVWALLSFHFNPLLLSLGVSSMLLVVWLSARLHLLDSDGHPLHLFFALPKFAVILLWRIISANIDVALRIIGLREVTPVLVKLPLSGLDDLGKVIYINAITLTPGTASVHSGKQHLWVHSLCKHNAAELRMGAMRDILPKQVQQEHQP